MHSNSGTEVAASEVPQMGHLSRWSRRLRCWASGIGQFVRMSWRRRQGADGAKGAARAPSVTVFDVRKGTEALLKFEARHGCIGQIEPMLDDIRRILDGEIVYSATTAEEIEQVWINLLRLGMLDDLLSLIRRTDLPFPSEICRFLKYCREQYDVCRERGEALRAQHPDCDLFTMGCIVWGEEYINNFLRYNFRSMLAEGNLPSLKRQGPVIFSIVTDSDGERRMRQHPLFASMSDIGQVEFTVIPDDIMAILRSGHLVRNFDKHPREFFWPVEDGVEIHSVFIHPLFTSASALQRYVRRHFANIDYGMIPRMFTDSRTIKVIDDPREAYVNNFTAANRLYETTGRPFSDEDFMRSHDKYSYSVQRSLFVRGQTLPCRLKGWTPLSNVD